MYYMGQKTGKKSSSSPSPITFSGGKLIRDCTIVAYPVWFMHSRHPPDKFKSGSYGVLRYGLGPSAYQHRSSLLARQASVK